MMKREMIIMALEEFYQSLYHDIFLKWIIVNSKQYLEDNIHYEILEKNENSQKLSFQTPTVSGFVTVWSNNIVEEEIILNQTQDQLFYLHYTIIDLAQAKLLFQEFYRTLLKHTHEQIIKIGICSSDGFSTTLFVEEMKEVCIFENSQLEIVSLSLEELYESYQNYDVIYLTPQIAYLEPELLAYTHHLVPIKQINPTTFATKDYQAFLKSIHHHFVEQERK